MASGVVLTLYLGTGSLKPRSKSSTPADWVACVSLSPYAAQPAEYCALHRDALLAVSRLTAASRDDHGSIGEADFDSIIGGGGGVQIGPLGCRVGGPSALAGLHFAAPEAGSADDSTCVILSRVRFEQEQPSFDQYVRLRVPALTGSTHLCVSVWDWKTVRLPALCGAGTLSLRDVATVTAVVQARQSQAAQGGGGHILPSHHPSGAAPVGRIAGYSHIYSWGAILPGTPAPGDASAPLRRTAGAVFAPAPCPAGVTQGAPETYMKACRVTLLQPGPGGGLYSARQLADAGAAQEAAAERAAANFAELLRSSQASEQSQQQPEGGAAASSPRSSSARSPRGAAPEEQRLAVWLRCDVERDPLAVRGALALRAVGVDSKHLLAGHPAVHLRRLGTATMPSPAGTPARSSDIAR